MIRCDVFRDNQSHYCTLCLHILTVSGSPVVRTQCFHCRIPGSVPVGELRSRKPRSTAKTKTKPNQNKTTVVSDPLELVPLFSGLCSKPKSKLWMLRIWDLVENEVCVCVWVWLWLWVGVWVYKLFFKTVLDLQKNWEDSTESSHVPHIQFPLLLSYISMVHLPP